MKYILVFLVAAVLVLVLLASCTGKGGKHGGTTPSLDSQIGSTEADNKSPDEPESGSPDDSTGTFDTDEDYIAENIAPPRDVFDVKLDRLNAPTNVAASDSTYNDKVVITWKHPSGVAPATYYVYRSETANNPSPTYIGGKSYPGTTFHDTTATPGTTYYYKLKSHKSGYNDSYFSTENSGKRSNRMNAPTGVTASDGLYNNKIAVTWNHPTGMTPLSYYIYRSTTPSDPAPTFVGVKAYPNKSINDTTAVYGTTYYYKIKSHKVGYNDSYFSNEDGGYMNNRMDAPINVNASDGFYDDKVHITWNHPAQGVVPTSYYIYRSETQNNPSPTYIGARSYPGTYYDDTTATPDTTYYYKVKSHKSGYLDSYFSNENSGRIAIWFLETVDSADDVGAYPGMTLDSSGNPHICYVDRTNYALKYANYDTSWHTETVDDTTEVTTEVTSIVLDSNEYPHISYVDQGNYYLKYAYYNGTTWSTETVDDSGYVNSGTSIELDSNDYPSIAYVDDTNHYLMFASNNGTEWFINTVDLTVWVDYYNPSLELDSDNHPHIGYIDAVNEYLLYAYFDGSSWQYETVDGTDTVNAEYCSLILDSYGYPHFAYTYSSGDLLHTWWNGTGWNTSTADNAGAARMVSLALDSKNNASVSYYDAGTKDLRYAKWTGSSWVKDVLDDSTTDTGRFTCIALDSNNLPHICYYDNVNGDLRYANLR